MGPPRRVRRWRLWFRRCSQQAVGDVVEAGRDNVPDIVGVVRGGVPRHAEDVGDLVGVMVRPAVR
jgi:hypothetical protein